MTGLVWVIPVGLIVGLAVGSLGAGGSILTVPALVYLLGQSPVQATTGSLIIVGITALVGVIPHHLAGNVRLAAGVVFGLVGVTGSLLGAKLASGVDPSLLLTLFAILMLAVAAAMVRQIRAGEGPDASTVHEHRRPLALVLSAIVVGLLTGFFGVGGGFAVVPALVLALHLPITAAVGTSLVVIVINSASALAGRLGNGVELDWTVLLGFAAFSVAGSLLGQRLTTKVSSRNLTIAFTIMLVTIAGYMLAMNVPAVMG